MYQNNKTLKRLSFLVILLISNFYLAQNNGVRKKIDSIYQSQWQSRQPDLDSLASPTLETVKINHSADSVIIKNKIVVPNTAEEIPMTPFNLIKQETEQRWFFFGQHTLTFNQASFSNWNAGGNDNIGAIGKINYNISYKRDKHYFENIIQLGYGMLSSSGQGRRKTEDQINIATNYGYDIGKNYYLSAGYQLITQFTAGYNYNSKNTPQYSDRISNFMAPGYLNTGFGLSYNPNENFQVILRPINGKFTFVLDPHLQKAGNFGLSHNGQPVRYELGAMANFLYRIKFYDNITLTNQFNFFTNYLYHPERVDVNYSGVLNLKFTKFITAVLSWDMLYDHDQIEALQRKQTLGIGFVYNLGAEKKPKEPKGKKVLKPFVMN